MNFNEFFQLIYQFFKTKLWAKNLKESNFFIRFFYSHLRIISLAFRNFFRDKCPLHASALTYYTMLSIVPVAALGFGISKGFGMQNTLREKLLEELPEHSEIVESILSFADSLLEVSRSGLISGIGIVLLLWAAVRVLGNIEETLNTIWGVKRSRTFVRRFSDFLTIMIIGPVISFSSSSLAVYIASQVSSFTKDSDYFSLVDPVLYYLLKLTPYFLIWLLFTLTYMIIPNTKVKFKSAFYGAIVAGTLFQWAQGFYLQFQFGAAKYSAIYGTFAALPLFLIWLQLSWFILLLGAEMCYASQNISSFIFEKESGKISGFNQKLLALQIAFVIIKNFEAGKPPIGEKNISKQAGIPDTITSSVINDLLKSKIIVRVESDKRGETYQPAKDINKLRVQDVLLAIENQGTGLSNYSDSGMRSKLNERLQKFNTSLQRHPQNILLKDI
jgi:membrane protein